MRLPTKCGAASIAPARLSCEWRRRRWLFSPFVDQTGPYSLITGLSAVMDDWRPLVDLLARKRKGEHERQAWHGLRRRL